MTGVFLVIKKMVQQTVKLADSLNVRFRRENISSVVIVNWFNNHACRACWQQTVVSPFDLIWLHGHN